MSGIDITDPSSASLIAGAKTSATVSFPLPNVSTVSTHAAAAPTRLFIRRVIRGSKKQTWDGDTVEVSKRNLAAFNASLTHVIDRQLLRRAAGTIHRLYSFRFGIIEETKGIPISLSDWKYALALGTDSPSYAAATWLGHIKSGRGCNSSISCGREHAMSVKAEIENTGTHLHSRLSLGFQVQLPLREVENKQRHPWYHRLGIVDLEIAGTRGQVDLSYSNRLSLR